jgi:hypothetical protein
MSEMQKERIKAKAMLGLKLTKQEESYFLLFIASYKERYEYYNFKRRRENAIKGTN